MAENGGDELSAKIEAPFVPSENYEAGDTKSSTEFENLFLRLRGLPFYAADEDVRKFFDYINVKSVTQVGNSRDGRPSGEAYVEFDTPADVKEAIEKFDRKEINGRYIEIFTVTDVELESERARGLFGDEGKVIRIRGLPWSSTIDDIKNFFEGLEVDEVLITKTGGRPSGDAYLVFATAEHATRAMDYNKKTMGSRYIEVFHSTIADLNAEKGLPESGRAPRPLMSIDSRNNEDNSPFKIYMRGLPFNADARSIEQFFSPLELVSIKIGYNEERRPSGDAIAIFGDTKNYTEALDRNKQEMGRRYVELFQADDKPPRMRDIMWKTVKGEGVGRPMKREDGGFGGGRRGGRFEHERVSHGGDYDEYMSEWSNRAVRRDPYAADYDRPQRRGNDWGRGSSGGSGGYDRGSYGYDDRSRGGYQADSYGYGRQGGYDRYGDDRGAPRGRRPPPPREESYSRGGANGYDSYGYGGGERFREPHGSSRGEDGEGWGGWSAAAPRQPAGGYQSGYADSSYDRQPLRGQGYDQSYDQGWR